MELLDLYNDNGKPIQRTVVRGEKFTYGNIMLSIVFIKNSSGKYLIQKTSKEKGSIFSSTGGHVIHGESGLETILREIKEELGIMVDSNALQFISLVKHPKRPCIINLYLLNMDLDVKNLKLQYEEVAKVYWLDENEILKLIEDDKFLTSHGYLFKKYIVNQ